MKNIKIPTKQKVPPKKKIENLYGIFNRDSSTFPNYVLTEKGAEELLDKINEIIKVVNKSN